MNRQEHKEKALEAVMAYIQENIHSFGPGYIDIKPNAHPNLITFLQLAPNSTDLKEIATYRVSLEEVLYQSDYEHYLRENGE